MTWIEQVQAYCENYNIPIEFLAETLYEPKVVPMIRGKAFEFSVRRILEAVLPSREWKVDKPVMNAQIGYHDTDVRVTHLSTGKVIRVECKLALKESFRQPEGKPARISVKCMRSRTLGAEMVKELAPKFGITESQLAAHPDQYLPTDFDVVVTSIGNAFYRTDEKTGRFEWQPSEAEVFFIESLNDKAPQMSLKEFAFLRLYVAKAQDLAVKEGNGITCTRRRCLDRVACGFIPNNPVIEFSSINQRPIAQWTLIENSARLFGSFVGK